jgi:hypothetical protein
MGYTTDFDGAFELDKPLTPEHYDYLLAFGNIRHMGRDVTKLGNMPDPKRIAAGLPLGEEGEFYVGSETIGFKGQGKDATIIDYNDEPKTQPSLWCQWIPTEDGTGIEWDGGEKFYNYVEWLEYLINNFLKPWGYALNGTVRWRGESFDDVGVIEVVNNEVSARHMSW